MPHCVIECPADLARIVNFDVLVEAVHDAADASGLFSAGDVKARLVLANHYRVGGKRAPYVHTEVQILSGRSELQKKALANDIARAVCELLPRVEMISVEVRDIAVQAYANRASLNTLSEAV
ncbi:5-carboxymethyl-2-hydroxymuconate Delta-isomerase [Agarivorans aestuarii]|uniref:5-carboxymethyl-2-hydroxymuconate Delta-isomerase n=1 Tax=Agarivorans aestuarii TaxID=1563703 RepID=A0ABU7G3B7_9ALTE|nr:MULTISPECIES: 5-carboxymethyl-2-hydroxymuconate Delta-isomerase [Agarivorans]MEE1673801.1 5-carboxymethyl-2-hydroxymuconate Delta-isomerase [Agarivorans aestuarii]